MKRDYNDDNPDRFRVKRLRSIYTGKAMKGMLPRDMHVELRSDAVGEPRLSDHDIADIVNCAYHPWNNPMNLYVETVNYVFDGENLDRLKR